MSTQVIREAVDKLQQAFQEFKTANDQRMEVIEKKGSIDPLVDEKVNRLNEFVEKLKID